MNQLQAEKISEHEIVRLYGKEALEIAQCFMIDGHINHPIYYKAFADVYLWYLVRSGDKERYQHFVRTYNEDVNKRFAWNIEVTKHISRHLPALGFGAFGFGVTSVYDRTFFTTDSGKVGFKHERDLEDVLLDSFYYWDDYLEVKRQVATRYGIVDLLLKDASRQVTFLVELKKRSAQRRDVYQILDYAFGYEPNQVETVIPLLIAFSFDDDVCSLANRLGVACYEYQVVEELPNTAVYLTPSNNNCKSEQFDDLRLEVSGGSEILGGAISGFDRKLSDVYRKAVQRAQADMKLLIDELEKLHA